MMSAPGFKARVDPLACMLFALFTSGATQHAFLPVSTFLSIVIHQSLVKLFPSSNGTVPLIQKDL